MAPRPYSQGVDQLTLTVFRDDRSERFLWECPCHAGEAQPDLTYIDMADAYEAGAAWHTALADASLASWYVVKGAAPPAANAVDPADADVTVPDEVKAAWTNLGHHRGEARILVGPAEQAEAPDHGLVAYQESPIPPSDMMRIRDLLAAGVET